MPALDADDLAQNGYIALLGVMERYDPATRVPIGAYLQARLKGSMKDSLRVEARQSKRDKPGRVPVGFSDPDDPHTGDRLEQLPGNGPAPDAVAGRSDTRRLAEIAIDALEGREREIILQIFKQGKSQREVGETLGLTPGRICQIQMGALRKMRTAMARYGISATRQIF